MASLVVAGVLAGCTGSGGGSSTDGANANTSNCTNKIVKKDAPVVTLWAWYPNTQKVVDNFNNAHSDVQVCWTNAGAGGAEYDKFQTAVSAGKGAPDVVMLEADRIPTFQVQDALVDLKGLGYNDVKDNFSDGAWKDVSVGDGVYGAPIDGGPMGMIYRTDIFQKYGITTPPKTWDEYAAAAQKVKDAGGPLFGDFPANQPAYVTALLYNNGATPFTYNTANKGTIGIKLNDDKSKQVLDYWAGLVSKGLVGKQDQFTPEYISGVIGGKYATYLSAAWAPGYLQGAGVGKGADAGVWATAPLPQWDPSNPNSVNWGGYARVFWTTNVGQPRTTISGAGSGSSWKRRAWRSSGRPVVHVRHMSTDPHSPLRPGQPGNAFKPETAPAPGEVVIEKRVNSAFIGTSLEADLRRQQHDHAEHERPQQALGAVRGQSPRCAGRTTQG